MYNRYVPQPDGSYRRNRVTDPAPQLSPPPVRQDPAPQPPPQRPPEPRRIFHPGPVRQAPSRHRQPQESTSIGSFLKQLLPKNFDTEDLLIVLLLLLMSGDCREDQNTALLTLVLYLFM